MSRYPSVDAANEEGRRLWRETTLRRVTVNLRGDGTVDARCEVSEPGQLLRTVRRHTWPWAMGGFEFYWQEAGLWVAESFWAAPTPGDQLAAHRPTVEPELGPDQQ